MNGFFIIERHKAVLRIRDVYPGSRIKKIPDPRSASKNLSIFKPKKLFISSRKYDPGCSSRIQTPDLDFLPSPDPGSRGQKGTGSRIRKLTQSYHKKVISVCV